MTKVLMTGGGYVGSVIVRLLKEQGFDVVLVDNKLFGFLDLVPNVMWFGYDVRDRERLRKVMQGVDVVVHTAGIVGDPACLIDLKESLLVNCDGARIVCEVARECGVKQFVHLSTCSVYGFSDEVMTEKQDGIPCDYYGMLKQNQEVIVQKYFPKALIFRLGTAFGFSPMMRFDLAMNGFVAKALNGEKLMVFGGKQQRPFVHVKDVARAVVFGIRSGLEGVFNLAGLNLSILEMAKEICALTEAEFVVNAEIQDRRNYVVSCKKLLKKGFEFKFGIKDFVDEMKGRENLVRDYKNPVFYRHKVLEDKKKV